MCRSLLFSDTMEKAPAVSVRSVTRAARHAGARCQQTASLAIHFSFSYAPRDSVSAPALSTTMQTNTHRPARGAIPLVTSATVRLCLCFAHENGHFVLPSLPLTTLWGFHRFPQLFLSPLWHQHSLSTLRFTLS